MKGIADDVRANALIAIYFAGSGHPGGSLSAAEILATLYFGEAKTDASKPEWRGRGRVFLSAQHKCPAQYAALALKGFFSMEEFQTTLRKTDSSFQGHPHMLDTPGIELSGGSLGHGFPASVGSALNAKIGGENYRVYCVMGDGEQEEGSVWEAAAAASHYELDNLCAVIDANRLQIDGAVSEVIGVEPLPEKYRAFGWHAIECDGHDVEALKKAFGEARATKGKPTAIIARTVKGKGVSFMENEVGWHGKAPDRGQLVKALEELGRTELFSKNLEDKAAGVKARLQGKYPVTPWNSGGEMKVGLKAIRGGAGACLEKLTGDERVVAVGADLNSSVRLSSLKERVFEAGIAEQNMMGMAAGLAKEGRIAVAGSFSIFATGRAWEFLRTSVCYPELNVKVIASHGGLTVGEDGATHQALEDFSTTTVIPNLGVFVPCDFLEACKGARKTILDVKGPVVLRLGRVKTPVVTREDTPFVYGKANVASFKKEEEEFVDAFDWTLASEWEGDCDAAIIACGVAVPEAMRAAWELSKKDVKAAVVNVHTLKPLDEEAILKAADSKLVVTVEEHQVGGLGNLVAGVLTRNARSTRQVMLGVNDRFGESGDPNQLLAKYGLNAEAIRKAVEKGLAREKPNA